MILAVEVGAETVGSHIAPLLIELGAVVLGLAILGRAAHRVGLSPVPLYLLGGLAFGHGGVLPLTASGDFVEVGAEIGVLLLLLTLGLEYSASELVGNLRGSGWTAPVDLVANATPGFLAGLLLGFGWRGGLALAGVTWVSSSGIVAKTLSDLGRLANRETGSILSVLVLEDLAMALYLPVLTVVVMGGGLARGSLQVATAVGVLLLVLVVSLRYGERLSRLLPADNPELLTLTLMGAMLLVAGLTQQLQVSAAVGAFLVGIAVSGPVAIGAHQLLMPLRDLFAAVFFVFFGLSTDPSEIPAVLLPAVALGVLTAATKVGSGWYAARRAGVGKRGRLRAGLTLTPRGEFSIVIAGLAATGLGEARLTSLAATYVLLLAVAGPLLARCADPLANWMYPPLPGREPRLAG